MKEAQGTHHFAFRGLLQMRVVSVHVGHKRFAAGQPHIRGVVFLPQMIRLEIAVCHKTSHV
jgi:hypothetical protein